MGWKPLKKKLSFFIFLQPFYVLSITTLTLLLPLSFLLLSRLSNSQSSIQTNPSNPFLFSTNPSLLHILISIITILSLFHTLTGRVAFLPSHPGRPGLHAAWVFLCAVQVCVVLGIQSTSTEPGSGSGFKRSWSLGLFSRAVFFVGVHETMMCWSRIVVRPVVDDAIWGCVRAEKWAERVVMTLGCGGLWWLRLRDEVEALAGAVEDAVGGGGGIGDFVGWWLYYLTVSIGMARVLKGVFWVGMVVFLGRFEEATGGGGGLSSDVGVAEEEQGMKLTLHKEIKFQLLLIGLKRGFPFPIFKIL